MPIAAASITGLVLCGGRGSRMGGLDKGLQLHRGRALALHAIERLTPQVGALMLSANRNLAAYAALGVPVWPDGVAGYPGPLAGWLAGLEHCATPWLATVPCDSPNFPADLVARLAAAVDGSGAEVVVAATRDGDRLVAQPVFALLNARLREPLAAALAAGERGVGRFAAARGAVRVLFDDERAFVNANTPDELTALSGGAASS